MAAHFLFRQHATRAAGVVEIARPFKDIGEGIAPRVDLERLAPSFGDKDVQILRVRRNSIDRPALAAKLAHDHLHDRAVIFQDVGNVSALHVLIARGCHLQRTWQVGPKLKAVHLALGVSKGHFLMQDARPRRHPLHIAAL